MSHPTPPPASVTRRLMAALLPHWRALGWPAPDAWRWAWDPDRGWQLELALVLETAEPLEAVLDRIQAQVHRAPGSLRVVELLRMRDDTCCWIRVLDGSPSSGPAAPTPLP
jgi:hypothetical protein